MYDARMRQELALQRYACCRIYPPRDGEAFALPGYEALGQACSHTCACWRRDCSCAQVAVEIIDHADLQFGKFLGQGAEGMVHAAWYMETPVAVKQTTSVQEIEMNLHAGKLYPAVKCECENPGMVHAAFCTEAPWP